MAKDILKEAIADAKAVREVALANAKAALEEAFTPRLQSMLSAKLSEELNEEEDLDETYMEDEKEDVKEMYDEDEKDMDEAYMEDEKEDLDEEIDLEEILNELELEESEEVSEDTVDEAKKDDDDKMEEAKKDDDKDDVKEAKDKEDDMNEAKGDKEDLDEQKPIYKAEYANDPTYKADHVNEDKEFDLDTLLEEINNLDENEDEVNEEVEETNEIAVTSALVGGLAGIIIGGTPLVAAKAAYDMVSPEKKEEMMKKYPKLTKLMDTLGVIGKAAGDARRSESISEAEKAASEDDLEKMEKALMGEDTQAEEIAELKAALEVKTTELNEVNLLNSKLLYVNRIFKANNLSESQKLRVVETLDNATNIKEAKLIYETIKDTFTVVKSTKTTPKKSIRENLGMASKAAGTSTAPKKPVLNESNDMVTRIQKLANIKINQ